MTSARSMTLTLSSRSRFAPCTGESSSSKMTSEASEAATSVATSSTLPSPMRVAGLGEAMCWETRPTTSAPAVSTRRVSSSRCSVICRASLDPFRGAATRTARSAGSRTGIIGRIGSPSLSFRVSGDCKGTGQTSQSDSAFAGKGDFLTTPRGPKLDLSFHLVGQIARSERRSHRTTHAGPAERQWEGQRGSTILAHREIVVIGDITQMLPFDVESHLELGAVESEAVRVLHIYDQIQVTSAHSDAAHHHPLQPYVRLLEYLGKST